MSHKEPIMGVFTAWRRRRQSTEWAWGSVNNCDEFDDLDDQVTNTGVRAHLAALSVTMALLMMTACGRAASHMDSPVNPWPSLASSPVRFLTSANQDLWPCFSPDGFHILFSRRVGETFELFLIPVVGGQPQQLANSPLLVSATRANWSKQKDLIAFTGRSSHGENRIWIINSDGLSTREVESHGLSEQMFYPSWFPSGEQIAAMDAQDMVIKKVDLNNGSQTGSYWHAERLAGRKMDRLRGSGKYRTEI
jgi:hypothetical protein